MERLTKRELIELKNGEKIVGCNSKDEDCNDYCMHGYCRWNDKALKKLKEYEDLEEQGLLLRLPQSDWKDLIEQINVIVTNDFVVYIDGIEYVIAGIFLCNGNEEFMFNAECRHFIPEEGTYWECNNDEECNDFDCYCSAEEAGCVRCFSFSDIGKTVFFTKEAAEAALKEMEK